MKTSGLADSPLFVKPKIKESKQPSLQVTTVSHTHDTVISSITESILMVGKEAATYRLTLNEKRKLAEIIYTLKMKNLRVTENEIIRIALNFILCDYSLNKTNSILKRVISLEK
jgi:hypothetical protein